MRNRNRVFVLVPLLALCLYLCWRIIGPFFAELTSAVILGVVLYPVYDWIRGRLRNRDLAAAAGTLLAVIIILAPAFLIGLMMAGEIRDVATAIRQKAGADGFIAYVSAIVDGVLQRISTRFGIAVPEIEHEIVTRLEALASYALRSAGSVVNSIGSLLIGIVLTCFILFFVFRQGHLVADFVYEILDLPPDRAAEISRRLRDTVLANVLGVILVAAVQGTLTGIGFWIVGLHSPLFWGVVAGIGSVIPIVGPWLVWGPFAIYLYTTGEWVSGLILTGWGTIVVGMSDNIVRPWVVGSRSGMNGLVVFFAILGGIQAFGLIGLFLGPLVFAFTKEVFLMIEEERHRLRPATGDQLSYPGGEGPE